jgi:hypothetical protein
LLHTYKWRSEIPVCTTKKFVFKGKRTKWSVQSGTNKSLCTLKI